MELDEMDWYSLGDESFDDVSDDDDADPFSVGYAKECEKAKHIKEDEAVEDD